MGPIQSENQVNTAATDINLVAGPVFASGFYVLSVLYTRVTAGATDFVLSAIWGDREFVIDQVTGATATTYAFPNARVPYPVALPPGCKVRFKTVGVIGAEARAVIIQLAQE